VNQSAASAQFVDVNVVSEIPEDAQAVAIETSIEAMTITLTDILGGHESAAEQIQEVIEEDEARITELTIDAGGFTPTIALDLAIDNVIQRRLDIQNPPVQPCVLPDGTNSTCEIEYNGPSLEELEAEASRLSPIEREFTSLDSNIVASETRLNGRNNSIRDTRAALLAVENERENQLILDEVVTEETSRIAGLLTGLLIFAIPAALVMIVLFTVFDLLFRKPESAQTQPTDIFESAGELSVAGQQSLPEAAPAVASLTVVDKKKNKKKKKAEAEEDDDIDDEHDELDDEEESEDSDDDSTPPTKKSKDNRWGRDAGSKAG